MKEHQQMAYSQEQSVQLSLEQIRQLRRQSGGRARGARIPALAPQERGERSPMSHAQERLWFLEQLGLVGGAYNISMVRSLRGRLQIQALERSLGELVRRHESLRTRFVSMHGTAVQAIDPPGGVTLEIRDLSGIDESLRMRKVRDIGREEVNRPFDLERGPLLRAFLLRLSEQEHVLLLVLHHIVSDGWSLGVLNRELGAIYNAYVRGEESPLPELIVQYADYALWQRKWLEKEVIDEQLRYWKQQLQGAPPYLQLPADRPRPAVESFNGALFAFALPAGLTEALRNLARREGATLFMVLLAGYQALLSRWTGQEDIVIGAPIAGRTHPLIEQLIGFFVNMLALRSDLSGNPSFRSLLAQVKETTLGAYAHQDLPFELLVKELRPERDLGRQSLIQMTLALQNFPQEDLQLEGLTWKAIDAEHLTTRFDVTLNFFEGAGELQGLFEYATDLFEEQTIRRLSEQLCMLLQGAVSDPDCAIEQLPLLPDQEREQLLRQWR
ncbi:MAG TPA: condensation domain-containing protein, partial [Steroidobacter sp.]|uniref:condensation domain-containing protein n=1 Tax=Steroidobacter sp. TaxID=1978227 RepID=UPI002EDA7461